jgi:hypothetical protein
MESRTTAAVPTAAQTTAQTTADVRRGVQPARAAIEHPLSTAISRERSATKERHYRGNDNAPLAFARGALA